MEWYFIQDGEQAGPLSDEAFAQHVTDGIISPETLVWNETMDDWCKQGELAATPAAAPAPAVDSQAPLVEAAVPETASRDGVCAECGNTFPSDDMVVIDGVSVCAACKPVALQKVKEGVDLPTTMNYAGFWTRFGAKFIDGMLLMVVNWTITAIFAGIAGAIGGNNSHVLMGASAVSMLCNLFIGASYTTYFLGSRGATLGKMACGIRVVMADGGSISYGRALGRHFAEMLSGMTLMIGYIIAAFDSEKRTLHDHICGTRVVMK